MSLLSRIASRVLVGCLLAGAALAQSSTYAAATTAVADPFATEAGGFLLAIPGVENDFVLAADGQFEQRANGTARLGVFLRRAASLDRELFLQLEWSGRLDPSSPGYPPAGSPIVTLQPSAYVPNGTVDPGTFVYYTQVTGSLVGVHSYAGAQVLATQAGPAQLGVGANNKNVQLGFSLDLALQVVQLPALLPFAPTGPAQLRATLQVSLPMCATHVDAEPQASAGPPRAGMTMPGVASDYVFLPPGELVEADDGTAVLHGVLARQSDHSDRWQCQLALAGRVDPQHPSHPPAGSPVLQLLPAAYAAQGGPIDPAQWRYYTQVTGQLTGAGLNLGGTVTLTANGAMQVGLGAGQANLSFGAMATLVPTLVTQPSARTLVLLGDVVLQTNLDTACILPTPQVLTGHVQTLANVTELPAVFTGNDLSWIEQVAIGPTILASTDPRRWFLGNFQVRDDHTVEVFLPQGMAVGTYPIALLDRSGGTLPMTLHVQAPATPTLRTESTVLTGEAQHWLVHQGNLVGPVLTYVLLSGSNTPSFLPGQISLGIGSQFTLLLVFPGQLHDFATGLLTVTIPSMPPVFVGQRMYCQAAMIELASANVLPLPTSNVWFTDY